jgi:protein-S-isoprenylcysteine O-methyltransferase Ste14
MIGRAAALIYGLASYLIFSLSFAYTPAFLGNFLVPKTIDVGADSAPAHAVVIDAILLGLFAIQHSVMARPAFKRWWTRVIPASCERSTYVLISSALLILIFWQWRPIAATVWRVEGWPAAMLTAIFWMGWLIALLSTFQIDHFELFGVRQVVDALRGAAGRMQAFKTPLLYRLVRHPLMLGMLLAFWATAAYDGGTSVVRHDEHRLHPCRRQAGGARPRCRVRRELRAVSPARSDALAASLRRRLRRVRNASRRLRCAPFFATPLKASKPLVSPRSTNHARQQTRFSLTSMPRPSATWTI